jgi:hypothetical protein
MIGRLDLASTSTLMEFTVVWQRLSVRTGKQEPNTPYDGVPPHLVQPFVNWIQKFFQDSYNTINNSMLRYIGLINKVVIAPNGDERDLLNQILNQCTQDEEFCLDIMDSILNFGRTDPGAVDELELVLALGGSNWRVAPDRNALVQRLDETAVGQSSAELAEAWRNAYGRNPNPSDAWDHAIKAVETVLIPIVCPTKNKPTLADVAGCLKAQPDQWKLQLEANGTIGAVETMEAMLRLIWPNPDRHGGAGRRTPTPEESQAVVQLAVALVQWGRTGVLTKR